MVRLLLFCLLASLSVAQSASSINSSLTFDSEAEGYVIYSIIINCFHEIDPSKVLLVVDHTFDPFPPTELLDAYNHQQAPCLMQATLNNYRLKNTQSHRIAERFNISYPHTLLDQENFDEIFKEGCTGWCKFHENYPDASGFIRFSSVGFDRMGTQALVCVSHGCGGLCGSGGYVVLAKQGEEWKIQKWLIAWVS